MYNSPKVPPFYDDTWPPNSWFPGPYDSTAQTTAQSVRSFQHSSWFDQRTHRHTYYAKSVTVAAVCLVTTTLIKRLNVGKITWRATHTHTRLTALCLGLPSWAGTRKVKPIWILLKQETVSGSGISWAIYKSSPRSGQVSTPASHRSVFYRPDDLPAAQPTASKHWRQVSWQTV